MTSRKSGFDFWDYSAGCNVVQSSQLKELISNSPINPSALETEHEHRKLASYLVQFLNTKRLQNMDDVANDAKDFIRAIHRDENYKVPQLLEWSFDHEFGEIQIHMDDRAFLFYAIDAVMNWVPSNRALDVCDCGSFFVRKRKDQHGCSTRCSSRLRKRRQYKREKTQ